MRLPVIKAPLAVFLNERQVEKSGGVNKKNFEGSQKSPGRRKVGREMVLLSACQGLCHLRETVESDSRSQLIPAPETNSIDRPGFPSLPWERQTL